MSRALEALGFRIKLYESLLWHPKESQPVVDDLSILVLSAATRYFTKKKDLDEWKKKALIVFLVVLKCVWNNMQAAEF